MPQARAVCCGASRRPPRYKQAVDAVPALSYTPLAVRFSRTVAQVVPTARSGDQQGASSVSKREFLERMQAARAELNEALSGLTEEQITQDIVAGEWSVKDILAHLAAWQNESVLLVERAARGEAVGPMINESVDDWNLRRVVERRRLPLVDVMQEFNDAHDRLIAALERWPEDHVPLGPGGWDQTSELWWLTEHDREHLGAIQAYRQRLAQAQ